MSPLLISTLKISGSLGLLLVLLFASHTAGRYLKWHSEVMRKFVHTMLGLYTLCFPLIFKSPLEVFILCSLVSLIWIAIRFIPTLKNHIGASLHGVERFSYGELCFTFSVAFLFYTSAGNIALYTIPLAILSFSDAFAAVVGIAYARTSYKVAEGTKSWEGSAIFFLSASLITLIGLLAFTEVDRINVIIISFLIALAGALIEATSWRGLDNLLIPIGLHLLLQAMVVLDQYTLLINSLAVSILMCLGILASVVRKSDVQVICLAMLSLLVIWIVGGWMSALAPSLLILALFIQQPRFAYTNQNLPQITAIIIISLFWYTLQLISKEQFYYAFNISLGIYALLILLSQSPHNKALAYTISIPVAVGIAVVNIVLFDTITTMEKIYYALTASATILLCPLVRHMTEEFITTHKTIKEISFSITLALPGVIFAQCL